MVSKNLFLQVLASFSVPMTDRVYRNNAWEQVGTTFRNYGKGAAVVAVESFGRF